MPCWVVAATDKQTQTYLPLLYRESHYRTKLISIVQEVYGNLFGLIVIIMSKFKPEDT